MNIYFLQKIETPRLTIRPVQVGDEVALNEAINKSLSLLQRWMPWAKDPSFKTTQVFVQRSVIDWEAQQSQEFPMVVIHKADNKIIAASGYNEKSDPTKPYYEIGYWIDADYQGQGFITEMVNALTKYALIAIRAKRVQICTQAENIKSIAVANRCGYKVEAIMKNYCIDCITGLPADSLLFSCCDIKQLPQLEITWQHKRKEKIFFAKTTNLSDNQPTKALQKLSTKNLILAPPNMDDANKLHAAAIASQAEIGPWFSWAKPNLSLSDIQRHLREAEQAATDIYSYDHLFYLVWDHNCKILLGEVCLKILDWSYPASVMLNYWFDTQHTGKGYVTEAIHMLIQYLFSELKIRRVQLQVATQNIRSIKLANRLGFSHEGTLTNHSKNFISEEIISSELFAITELSALKK